MKKLIFNLLPRSIQRKIIFKKTGVLKCRANLLPASSFEMFIIPNSKLWVDRLATYYGHEPLITNFFEKNIKPDDICYEIGAQMGYFPSLISQINPNVKIFAFEASWYSFNYLIKNKELNDKKDNWKIFNYFISDQEQKIAGEQYITINNFIKKGAPVPTLFQMDVDGEEYRIINGASNLLGNGVTEFLIEVHPKDLKERGIDIMQFLNLFKSNAYQFVYLPNLRANNSNWVNNLNEVDLTDEFYLYAVPVNKQSRINV